MFFKKKITIVSVLLSMLFIGIAANNPETKDPHKNLKVLPPDISNDSLDKIMDGFKAALGVKCNFCHARKQQDSTKLDFASDDKPEKNIARHMMIMTRDINQKYFNFNGSTQPDTIRVVGCVTCHKGNPHPDEMDGNEMHEHNEQGPPPQPGQPAKPQ